MDGAIATSVTRCGRWSTRWRGRCRSRSRRWLWIGTRPWPDSTATTRPCSWCTAARLSSIVLTSAASGRGSSESPGSVVTVIAIDAMGGDQAPVEIVKGVAQVSLATEIECVLVGDERRIQAVLDEVPYNPEHIEVLHAADAIAMGDD